MDRRDRSVCKVGMARRVCDESLQAPLAPLHTQNLSQRGLKGTWLLSHLDRVVCFVVRQVTYPPFECVGPVDPCEGGVGGVDA